MKKLFFFFFTVGILTMACAQTKVIFMDEFRNPISEKEFLKTEINNHIYTTFNSDTLVVKVKSKEVFFGKLNDTLYGYLKNGLQIKSKKVIKPNSKILIVYHPGDDKFQQAASAQKVHANLEMFSRSIKKIKNVFPFFVFNSTDGLEKYGKVVLWQDDYRDTIKKLFFPIQFLWGGYVIIEPSGNFSVFRGEYYFQDLTEILKSKKS